MNINTVFNARVAPRPEPSRSDAPRADNRPDRVDHRVDQRVDQREDHRVDESERREPRAPARSEFSALFALLAGAGTQVRADLMRQLPADGVSLIDKMLDGGGAEADATGDSGLMTDVPGSLVSSSQRATDAMR